MTTRGLRDAKEFAMGDDTWIGGITMYVDRRDNDIAREFSPRPELVLRRNLPGGGEDSELGGH